MIFLSDDMISILDGNSGYVAREKINLPNILRTNASQSELPSKILYVQEVVTHFI